MIAIALALTGAAGPAGELAAMLEGRWDNAAQVEAETDPMRPHLHVVHERFEAGAAPGALIYAQLRVGGPDGELYRQRVYGFEPDPEGGVDMAVYVPADGEAMAGAFEAGALDALGESDLVRFEPGFDFDWSRAGQGWTGTIEDGACRITSSRSGREMIILGEFTIAPERFTHSEAGRDAQTGEVIFAPPNETPNLYDRVN